MIKRFLESRCGTTAIEYSLIAALVSVIILVAVESIGSRLNTLFYGPLMSGLK